MTDKTRKMLWGRSGGVCAMCHKQWLEDEGMSDDPSVLGQECHIVGEQNSPNSPRGLDSLPLNQRNLFDNLILLCRDHPKIIDDQPENYTIEELHRIKNDHIVWVRQTLGFDEAKQLDDERYLAIAQQWAEMAGLNEWGTIMFMIVGDDSPTIKQTRFKQLDSLQFWLLKLIYPERYQSLNNAFQNFLLVLHDFIRVFGRHTESKPDSFGNIVTPRFYRLDQWNPERHNALLKEYEEHTSLLTDLALELTRTANYICELMRKHFFLTYRLHDGWLVVRTGLQSDFATHTILSRYQPDEYADFMEPDKPIKFPPLPNN